MDTLVLTFTRAATPREQDDALVGLIKAKRLHAAARDPAFMSGMTRLVDTAADPARGMDRLRALAAIGRAVAVVKALQPHVNPLLAAGVRDVIPALQQLDDPNERLYAATSCRAIRQPWCPEYLAVGAVQEESGEKVRTECLEGMLELSVDLTEALRLLKEALGTLRFGTQKPGDSAGRRTKRLLESLRAAFASVRPSVGQETGDALTKCLEAAFRTTGDPSDDDVKVALTEECALLVHEIVRSSFSVATGASTYGAIEVTQRWFEPHTWADQCEASTAMRLVNHDITESLVVLGRAGVSDDDLLKRLTTTSGSAIRAREICRELAATVSGLPDDVREWFMGKPPRRRSELAAESQERAVDEVLAELLLQMQHLKQAATAVRLDVVPEVSTVMPRLTSPIAGLVGYADAMAAKMDFLAQWRSLRVEGQVGQELEFSPLQHQLSSGPTAGVRHVRISTPGVLKVTENGVPRIVKKALVEPAKAPTLPETSE